MSEALFAKQGAPYANFKGQGTHYEGTIVRLGQIQSRKYVPEKLRKQGVQGELEHWPDGKPKMTAIITIQTDQRDPEIQGDDGQRSLWIKGKSMTNAVQEAIAAAGASRRGVEVGGYFSMTFTHTTPPEFEDASPTKHYAVEYVLPENNSKRVDADPWAAASPPEGFIVAPGTPVAEEPSQAPQQAPVAGNGPSSVDLSGFDVSNMTPAAREALKAMIAAQSGGQQ